MATVVVLEWISAPLGLCLCQANAGNSIHPVNFHLSNSTWVMYIRHWNLEKKAGCTSSSILIQRSNDDCRCSSHLCHQPPLLEEASQRQIEQEPREVSLQNLSRAVRLCLIPEKINTQPMGFNNSLAQDLRVPLQSNMNTKKERQFFFFFAKNIFYHYMLSYTQTHILRTFEHC